MGKNEGIVEARSGQTRWGYKYIYTIGKSSVSDFGGVEYILLLDISSPKDVNDVVEVHGYFDEIGTTGMRESIGIDFARRAGLGDMFTDEGRKKWTEDPYDPAYRKGYLKNLSEKEGLDIYFPYHPLSQAHEFLYAALQDEFVEQTNPREKKEEEKSQQTQEVETSDRSKQNGENLLRSLFVDKNMRVTYPVDILHSK